MRASRARAALLLVVLWRGGGTGVLPFGQAQPGKLFPTPCDLAASPAEEGCSTPFPQPQALFSLDAEEGVAYLQVQRTESRSWHDDDEGAASAEQDPDVDDGAAGWVEVYQEGHRLMANFSGSEISIAVGGVDTYLWASVFDGQGRWVAQSNVLHTGHHAGVSVDLDDSVSRQTWLDGEPLTFGFGLRLRAGFDQQAVSSVIVLIDNQTVGMMRLDMTVQSAEPAQEFTYHHHGEVEVGLHSLHLALLEAGRAFPSALSQQRFFAYEARPLDILALTVNLRAPGAGVGVVAAHAARAEHGEDATAPYSASSLIRCILQREAAIPPNRQYTEVLDGIDVCIAQVGPTAAGAAGAGDAGSLGQEVRAALLQALDRSFSAVVANFQVGENFLRSGRTLYLLGLPYEALRAWKTVQRLVGIHAQPTRTQCTYPGCNEMPKDTCNLISRLLHAQREPPSSRPPRPAHRPAVRAAAAAAGGGEGAGTRSTGQLVGCVTEAEEDSYSRHLADIFPPHSLPDGQIVSELAAGGEVRGGRYSIRDLAVGCLTTNATYRTRAARVVETWWQHLSPDLRHFYGDAPDDVLPVTPYMALDERWAGSDWQYLRAEIMAADYGSSLPKFFLALLDLYLRHPHVPWYLLVGDDNFVVPRHVLMLLEHVDSSEKYVVGGPVGQHVGVGDYISGGSGLLFSNGLLRASWRHIGPFAASWRKGRGQYMLCHPCADVAFGFFMRDVGAVQVEIKGMHGMWPEYYALHTSAVLPACAAVKDRPRIRSPLPATFHYVQPRAMGLLARHFFGTLDESRDDLKS